VVGGTALCGSVCAPHHSAPEGVDEDASLFGVHNFEAALEHRQAWCRGSVYRSARPAGLADAAVSVVYVRQAAPPRGTCGLRCAATGMLMRWAWDGVGRRTRVCQLTAAALSFQVNDNQKNVFLSSLTTLYETDIYCSFLSPPALQVQLLVLRCAAGTQDAFRVRTGHGGGGARNFVKKK
jgi:hypothetical protein